MILDRSLPASLPARNAVAFGNFDGVHLGHRALIGRLVAEARAHGGEAVVVTFDPHPLTVLRPDRAPPAIDSLPCKLANLRALGVDRAVVLQFDAQFALMPAEAFASDVLFGALGAKSILAGHDTRFGHGGLGDAALLAKLAAQRGAQVLACTAVLDGELPVSSSRVRKAIAAGHMDDAARWLGRPWQLDGAIVHGDHRGRTIGFPTANFSASQQIRPGHGVYACWLRRPSGQTLAAVANCGVRPTFGSNAAQVEAHCLDFAGDLYGETASLLFVARLRGEQKFAGLAELKAQIAADVAQARALLATHAL